MKKMLVLTAYLSITLFAFSQPLKLPLLEKRGQSFARQITAGASDVRDYSLYTGYDSTKYEKFAIRQIFFSLFQYTIESQFIDANRSKERAFDWHKKYSDTTYFLYQKVPKNYAAYIYATGKNGLIHFTVDANNNRRFDDDKEYIFDTASAEKYYPDIDISFEYYDGKKMQTIIVPYRANPYTSHMPAFSMGNQIIKYDVLLNCSLYKEAIYKQGDQEYVFNIVTDNMGIYKNEPFHIVIQLLKNNTIVDKYPYQYNSNQILEFDQGLYKIDSLTKDTLYLNKIETISYGANVGSMSLDITGNDVMNGNSFSLRSNRGKYTVINFWGSWCGPCVEELPQLKALQQKYNQVTFLSVAYDKKKDVSTLKGLITSHDLRWPQVWVDKEAVEGKELIYNYKIMYFPTTLLIDPAGKIVLKGSSATALKDVDAYLSERGTF